jgi:hypothetical protein
VLPSTHPAAATPPSGTTESSQSKFNSIQFCIIYVPSQQLQGQLQTQHSVDTVNYIMDTHSIKPHINYRKFLEENTLMEKVKKQTSKQTKMRVNKNYITQYIIRTIK